jgi:Protein of unknown function (DUF742)
MAMTSGEGDPSRLRPYLDHPGGGTADRGSDPGPDRGAEEASGLRPYLMTGGRARPVDADLEIEAQVVTTHAGRADADQLVFERRDIIMLCEQPIAIAEIAARLGLHLGVARVLAGDLIALGYLAVRRPDTGLDHDPEIIERVIRGLQTIR